MHFWDLTFVVNKSGSPTKLFCERCGSPVSREVMGYRGDHTFLCKLKETITGRGKIFIIPVDKLVYNDSERLTII